MGLKSFVKGGIASIVAGCSTHPLDLIKVRMQLQGEQPAQQVLTLRPALAFHPSHAISVHNNLDVHPTPLPQVAKSGPIFVGIKIMQTEGVAALFSGVSATVLRSFVLAWIYDF